MLSTTAQNLLGGCPACILCQEQQNCCSQATACLTDPGCSYYANCQNNCYNGMTADGGALPDASQAAEDTCANNCLTVDAGASAMPAWTAYQNCVSPACDTQCLCP
jgi:hypothetical protein